MSSTTYTFPSVDAGRTIILNGIAPFNIVFEPSQMSIGTDVINKITYIITDSNGNVVKNVTRCVIWCHQRHR
jgi:hypothetical protein